MSIEYLVAIIVLVVVLVLSLMRRKPELPKEDFINLFLARPKLWFLVDDHAIKSSYVQAALLSAKHTQSKDFDIVPLLGRDAVLANIKGSVAQAKQLPANLWRLYAIANLLKSQGGLVMDGTSTLCVGPSLYSNVRSLDAATFGINPDEAIVSPATAAMPGPAPYAAWASSAGHPAWIAAADVYTTLVHRGPQAWSAAEARRIDQEVWETQKSKGAVTIRGIDGGRLANGKSRQLEDLLGRVAEPADPKSALLPGTAFVSYNGDDLARRHEFNWFLRLSLSQIKESDLVWAKLAGY